METYSFLSADDILTPAISEAINSTDSQIASMQDTQLVDFIHWLNAVFVRSAHTKHHAGGFSFMEKVTNFQTKAHTTFNGAVAAGAGSVILTSGANWDSTGRSVAETTKGALDFFDHSAKSTHTLTISAALGAETISMAHANGEKVHKLYALPSDFAKVKRLRVNETWFEPIRCYGWPTWRYFTTYGSYILMPYGEKNSDCTLWYERQPNSITTRTGSTSTTNIPDRAHRWAVYMTLFHLFMIRRKRGDLETADIMAQRDLEDFISYDSFLSTDTALTFG